MGREIERREALKCMAWAGTGALYALSGGIARAPVNVTISITPL